MTTMIHVPSSTGLPAPSAGAGADTTNATGALVLRRGDCAWRGTDARADLSRALPGHRPPRSGGRPHQRQSRRGCSRLRGPLCLMVAAGGFSAWLVYRYLGLKFVSQSWFNLDATWAFSLVLVGALSLAVTLSTTVDRTVVVWAVTDRMTIFGSEAGDMRCQFPVVPDIRSAPARKSTRPSATFAGERPEALFFAGDDFFTNRRVQLVNRRRYPAGLGRETAEPGGLMSYGSNVADAWGQVRAYCGRNLKVRRVYDQLEPRCLDDWQVRSAAGSCARRSR